MLLMRLGATAEDADWRNVVLTHNGKDTKGFLVCADAERRSYSESHLLFYGDILFIPRNDDPPKYLSWERQGKQSTLKMDHSGIDSCRSVG